MRAVKAFAYVLLAVSLLPVITTYFAYGSPLELGFLLVTLLFGIGLLYLVFAQSPRMARVVSLLGVCVFTLQLLQLGTLWFNNDGGDTRVAVVFSFQAILTLIVLLFLVTDTRVPAPSHGDVSSPEA